jgi:crotonobetainyl-CoA:carnitine CoA-transferase CaiB-like acyl-CoA transferase
MLEALVGADSITFASVLNGGPEHGNPRPGLLVYEIGGRYLAVQAVGAPELWKRLLGVMGRPELAQDTRFVSSDARWRNGRELREIIGTWISRFESVDAALEVLGAARIPCAPVLRPAELINSPHMAERAFFPTVPHATRGAVRITASPYHIDGEPVHPRGPAAYRIGQHTRDVLANLLGYDTARIAELGAAGVIQEP